MDNGLILVFDKTVKTVLYEFLIKRLKAFYQAAGLRPAALPQKTKSIHFLPPTGGLL
ncbi:MAG: hypothetical protein ACLTR8_15370 [Oscillospiraceae bacterium]